MIVENILLEALARAGDIKRGSQASTRDIEDALVQFNSQLRKYSDNNMVTAFQKVLNFTGASEVLIGDVKWREGVVGHVVTSLPSANDCDEDDVYYNLTTKKFYKVTKVSSTSAGVVHFATPQEHPTAYIPVQTFNNPAGYQYQDTWHSETVGQFSTGGLDLNISGQENAPGVGLSISGIVEWMEGGTAHQTWITGSITYKRVVPVHSFIEVTSDSCTYGVPDVYCPDIAREVSMMFLNNLNRYQKLQFIPLAQFFMESEYDIYSSQPAGTRSIRIYLPENLTGRNIRMIYNSNMKFDRFDELDLPDAHQELITVAVQVALLSHDGDADPQVLNNAKEELLDITNQIKANTVSNRMLMREDDLTERREERLSIITGDFLYRR